MKLIQEGNDYHLSRKRAFEGETISAEFLDQSIRFAYEMTFGQGHHRSHRSGGSVQRKNGQQFCHVLQGKLAELVVHQQLVLNGFSPEPIDFGIYGIQEWDDADIIVNGQRINVKSAAYFSHLLLLETKDWDENGQYLPNISAEKPTHYDYFVLVRIHPDIKGVFKRAKLFYENSISLEQIEAVLKPENWLYDIAGVMNHKSFVHLITYQYILPQGAMLNGRVEMDAANYYIQSGSLRPMGILFNQLKAIQ